MPAEVREIKSASPFQQTALEYQRKGWEGPVPLPAKKKWPPPTGWTGRSAPYADEAQIEAWSKDRKNARANIGLRMGGVTVDDTEYDVIGIDVDHYDELGAEGEIKKKRGYTELVALQKKLGRLPATWTSSARTDGKSGTRFFLVPRGLAWPGKMGDNIDVVQRVHRYSLVYPSFHPTHGQCRWYRPGDAPNGDPTIPYNLTSTPVEGGNLVKLTLGDDIKIPDAHTLPMLPKKWVDHFTDGGTKDEGVPMDMMSSPQEILEWAKANFAKGRGMCGKMEEALQRHKESVEEDASSHDKVTSAHWEIFSLGLEGHTGWSTAYRRFEKFWSINVTKRGKRSPSSAAEEAFRSRTNAIRKIKGKVDEADLQGIKLTGRKCTCFKADDVEYEGIAPTGKAKDPGDYSLDDDGNGDHMMDLYGDDLKFVKETKDEWIFWNGQRWHQSNVIGRQCWRVVRDRHRAYATQLSQQAFELQAAGADDNEVKASKDLAKMWRDFARRSGGNHGAGGALEAARHNDGVSVSMTSFDTNPYLLGVENGVIELVPNKGIEFRKAKRDDFVVYNTGIPYMDIVDIRKKGGDLQKGMNAWSKYLDTFVPDMEIRAFTQKVLGYCLLGQNTERLAVYLYGASSTGKSTMLDTVMAALGDYASSIRLEMLVNGKDLNPELAFALPRRIVTTSEAGASGLKAEAFKRIVGGDEISVELKGSNDIIRRKPAFTPVFATNIPPQIDGADQATMRRVLTIPFNEEVPHGKEDKDAAIELSMYSGPVVLWWLVEGWIAYCKEGLSYQNWPERIKKETHTFSLQMNDIGEFVSDYLVRKEGAFTATSDIHDEYLQWALMCHVKETLPKHTFSRKLGTMGFTSKSKRVDGKLTRGFDGVELVKSDLNLKGFKR